MKRIIAVLFMVLVALTSLNNVLGVNDNQIVDGVLEEPKLDVVFLIDSTGSMADEIRSVKLHIKNIVNEVRSGQPTPELRVGIVTYRDYELEEPEYLYKTFDLSDNIDDALDFIEKIEANGGGDEPEAVADGLHIAINGISWSDARRLIFLIGDAPPHGEGSNDGNYQQGSPNGYTYEDEIVNANEKNVTIYTISGSGMDEIGVRIWREIAEKTHGKYEKLSYERRDVDKYFEEEKIEDRYLGETKADRDFDSKSNTILTNSFGVFGKSAMVAEASKLGVSYDSDTGKQLTGRSVDKVEESNKFTLFLKSILGRLFFWR